MVNLVADLTNLPLPEASFDIAVAWHVLEHIPQDDLAVAEIHRVIRPGGCCIFSVPIHPPNRAITFEDPTIPRERFAERHGHPDHVRSCGRDYWKRFELCGFMVDELGIRELSEGPRADDVAKYGLSTNHVAWCCIKRMCD